MADDVGSVTFNVNVESEQAQKNLKSVSNSVEEFGKTAQSVDTKTESAFSKINLKAVALAAAVGAAMVKLGKAALDAFNKFDEGSSIIAKATGATGKDLDALNDSFKTVYQQVEQSSTEVAGAIGEINTRFGTTGKALEDMATSFLDFADVTNTDVVGAVQNVSKVMKQWQIDASELPDVLDKLVVAGQQTGVNIDSLTQSLQSNAGTLQSFGYSMDDAISMMMSFESAGVDANEVLMGMKQSFADSAAAGTDARADWENLIDTIKNSTSETEANSVAIDKFGTRIAGSLVQGLRNGTIQFDAFTESLENSQGALEKTDKASETMADRLEKIKHVGETVLAGVVEQFAPALEEIAPALIQCTSLLAESLAPAFVALTPLINVAAQAISKLVEFLTPMIEKLGEVVTWLGEATGLITDYAAEQARLAAVEQAETKAAKAEADAQKKLNDIFSTTIADNPKLQKEILAYNEVLEKMNQNTIEGKADSEELAEDYEYLSNAIANAGLEEKDLSIYAEMIAESESKAADATEDHVDEIKDETSELKKNTTAEKQNADAKEITKEQVAAVIQSLQEEGTEYDNLMAKYQSDREVLQEALDNKLLSQQEYAAAVTALDNKVAALQKKNAQESAQATIDTMSNALGYAEQALSSLSQAVNDYYDMELNKVEATYRSELAALQEKLDNGEISQEEYNAAVEQLETDTAKEKDRIAKEQFEANKATQIATAVINAAQAALMCFAQLGPIGGAIAAVAIAVTTGIEIAKIKSQQYVSGSYATGAYDVTSDQIAQIHKGETILKPADATRFRDLGGMYGLESALASSGTSAATNSFNVNNQLTATIEVDGTQLGIAVLKNIDNARAFVF